MGIALYGNDGLQARPGSWDSLQGVRSGGSLYQTDAAYYR